MNHISRLITVAVVAVTLVSPVIAQASPRSRLLDEDAKYRVAGSFTRDDEKTK